MPSFIDETGKTYGHLTVLRRGQTLHGCTTWICRCKCRRVISLSRHQLHCKSRIDCKFCTLVGQVFGQLTVLRRVKIKSRRTLRWSKERYWYCQCSCKRTVTVPTSYLQKGRVRSCGHLRGRRYDEPSRIAMNQIIGKYKKNAQQLGRAWSLTLAKCKSLFASPCEYCGAPPSNQCKMRAEWSVPFIYNGIDRVDNNRGYTNNNVVPCCRTCNTAKHAMTKDDFLNWVKRVARHQNITADRCQS